VSGRLLLFLGILPVLLACGSSPVQPVSRTEPQGPSSAVAQASRTLVFIARAEPSSMGRSGGIGIDTSPRFFNATLMIRDGEGSPQPQLAEVLPQLGSASWQVNPDGTMETTYRLKPNLVWHDGEPFSADDLVFAWQVHRDLQYGPTVGTPGAPPDSLMDQATAPDPQTFIVHWREVYPYAGLLSEEFRPLPRHVLEPLYQQVTPEQWDNLPFWTKAYVGLGAYRIDQWEPGAFIEGVAFDRYVFGRPKIDRLRLIFQQDPNAVTASLLSGAAHLVADITIRFETGRILQQAWASGDGGTVLYTPAQVRFTRFQLRPEAASPRAILEPDFRKAIAHAIDKQALADALYEGQGTPAEVFAPERAPQFPSMLRAATKYPHDPRQAQDLLERLGFSKGADGIYGRAAEGPLSLEWRATEGGDSSVQVGVLTDALRQVGIDAHPFILPRPFDNQTRASFPGLMNWSTVGQPDDWLMDFTSAKRATAENRWSGINFGGWSKPEYDRLAETLATSLDLATRTNTMVQMTQVMSEEVPVLPLYYSLDVVAHVAALRGVKVARDGSIAWNVEQWELK